MKKKTENQKRNTSIFFPALNALDENAEDLMLASHLSHQTLDLNLCSRCLACINEQSPYNDIQMLPCTNDVHE